MKGRGAPRWCEVLEQLAGIQVLSFLMRKSQRGITATIGKILHSAVGLEAGNGWELLFTEVLT